MMKRVLSGLALCVFGVSGAMAQEPKTDLRPYLSGMYNLTFADDGRASDRGEGYSFGVGKALNHYWGMEFGGFYGTFDDKGGAGTSWRTYGGNLDALFFYERDPAFSPYFTMGIGYAQNDQKNGTQSEGSEFAAAGLGFMKAVGDHLGLRADVRYRVMNNESLTGGDFEEPIVRVGLTYALGDKPKAMKTAMSNMFDSDGDGVLEDKDRCPGTPTGVPGDATGCPDSDGDGVGDAYDECPGTPKGVRVDSRGCSLDSDGDGVFDYADKCPNTPAGVAVDADGCPATGDLLRKFEDVNFAFDRSDLTDYAKITLDNTAKVIKELQKQYPDLRVEISGHADWVGSEAYNLNLGLRRAAKVRDYLVSKGVSRGLISTTSLGESQPIASNKTDKGRLLNRRAEIRAKGNSK